MAIRELKVCLLGVSGRCFFMIHFGGKIPSVFLLRVFVTEPTTVNNTLTDVGFVTVGYLLKLSSLYRVVFR